MIYTIHNALKHIGLNYEILKLLIHGSTIFTYFVICDHLIYV